MVKKPTTRQSTCGASSIQAATLKKCEFDKMKDMVNDPKYATMTKDCSADDFHGYATLLRQIKQRVQLAQRHAIYSANEEMLRMYWDVGCMLQQSQQADGWGKKTLQRLSVDLKNDYPEIKGFSVRNMQCMMQFFIEYNQELTMIKGVPSQITQSVIAQSWEYNFTLPVKHLDWTHNLILMQQVKDIRARYWYMVIELKDTEFKPEYIGKLNFYCSAVDDTLCREGDNRTIGLLLCRTKDRIKAEYALRDIQKPIGISDYELGQALPKDFKGSLPTIEEIENELEENSL